MKVLHGKGGHGRVVADSVKVGTFDAWTDDAEGTAPKPSDHWHTAVGDNRVRQAKGGVMRVFHPTACVSNAIDVGEGTYIGPHAVVNTEAVIGRGCIINTGAIVEHDCRVGDYSHIAPGAVLCGGVRVGEGAFVGAGAVVRPGIQIGDWAVIGCGAAVVCDVPAGETWAGVPARCLKPVSS